MGCFRNDERFEHAATRGAPFNTAAGLACLLTPGEVTHRDPSFVFFAEAKYIDFPDRGSGAGARLGHDGQREVFQDN